MNYNFISQLLDNGISEDQILASISKAVPHLAKKARKMISGGWSAKDIINVFSKDKEAQQSARKGLKPTTPSEMAALHLQNSYNNIPQSSGQQSKEKLTQFTKDAAPYALGYAGSKIAGPIVGSVVQNALERALPQQPLIKDALAHQNNDKMQGTVPLPQSNQTQDLNALQHPANQIAASISEPANIQQSKGFDTNIIKNGLAYRRQIDALIKSGNGPEEIEAYLKKFNPSFIKNIEKEGKGAFKDIVAQYMQEKMRDDAMQPEGSIPKAQEEQIQPQLQEAQPLQQPIEQHEVKAESQKISKNSIVSSLNGIGEVKAIKENTALIDIDGKLTKVDIKDLESEPPDIAELYDNLFDAIPKEYQSRMMNYAGYDEDANELIFRPHGGAAYVYKDIPPQFAEDLKNRLHNAKTTGKNMYGMWNEGDPSYGAGMSALIEELQKAYGGKGKEYVRKYNTLFDILGIPHEEKKRKKQEERRKRKANG